MTAQQSNFETFGKAEEVYSFDQPILAEEHEYTLLEDGTYPFVITDVAKKFYEPKEGSKLPSCPQAQITLEVDGGDQGKTKLIHNLFYTKSTIWKVTELFMAVGLAKKGENYNPDPDQLMGKSAMCELTQQNYVKNDGNNGTRNEIKKCFANPNAQANGYGAF